MGSLLMPVVAALSVIRDGVVILIADGGGCIDDTSGDGEVCSKY